MAEGPKLAKTREMLQQQSQQLTKALNLGTLASSLDRGQVVVTVQSLSHIRLFAAPWAAAGQASLTFAVSWSSVKFLSSELVMPSSLSFSAEGAVDEGTVGAVVKETFSRMRCTWLQLCCSRPSKKPFEHFQKIFVKGFFLLIFGLILYIFQIYILLQSFSLLALQLEPYLLIMFVMVPDCFPLP